METRKIAVACFVGGALCCAVALMFTPVYWWFGLIAGMAGGYIGYEFREICRAVPTALRAAGRGSACVWGGLVKEVKEWLSCPHPFFYLALLVASALWVVCDPTLGGEESPRNYFLVSVIAVGYYALFVVVFVYAIGLFAMIGARISERCYWVPTMEASDGDQQKWFASMQRDGYHEVPLTYENVLRWSLKGLGLMLKFFAWTLWKFVAISGWMTLCFLGRFVWHLFKLIHSEKRVLCAIDGTLGGAVSYIWFASSAVSLPERAVFVVFGGLLGAAFGVANWEIVSKRILRVASASNA